LKVLTTIPGTPGKFWADNTTLVSDECRTIYISYKGRLQQHFQSLRIAIKLILKRKGFDVIVVDGGPIGAWFSWLQGLTPLRRTPTLMIDCLWYKQDKLVVKGAKRVLTRLGTRGVDKFAVWARHEVQDYSRYFKLPQHKFVFIPFHTTTEGYTFEIKTGDYIFSGGDGDRDYSTLIEAVKGFNIKVFIAARKAIPAYSKEEHPNIMVRSVTPGEFRNHMAGSKIVVVPMKSGLLHSGGQQTYLNAMAMGKPVIVCSPAAGDYIEHWKTGVVLLHSDVNGLREAIVRLIRDSNLASEMGKAAKDCAKLFSTENTMRQVLELAKSLTK
jgi:glycosyltransferase involved in cell wall biosynthesis